MVRIFKITKQNVKKIAHFAYLVYRFQEFFTHIKEVNNNKHYPCIYAMWHANQCLVHGIEDKNNLNILISNSKDGDIVAYICENWGFRVLRGSTGRKGCVNATMQMISELKANRCGAIMVDGPKGPAKVVKEGVIRAAKLSGAPIIPCTWYSTDKTWLKFDSWDNFRIPFLDCKLVNLYGDPIYVNADNTPEQDEECRLKLQNALLELDERIPQVYEEMKKAKAWRKKKSK